MPTGGRLPGPNPRAFLPGAHALARARARADLTQRDLAELLGVSTRAVRKWEKGQSIPSHRRLPAMALCLGISEDELESLVYGEWQAPAA